MFLCIIRTVGTVYTVNLYMHLKRLVINLTEMFVCHNIIFNISFVNGSVIFIKVCDLAVTCTTQMS